MKARDKVRLATVRSIKKVILEKESEVRPKGQDALPPDQEIEIVTQLAKQRKDSIEQYQNAGRDDLAEQEIQELAILQEYLPEQMSDADIEAVIDELITKTGASGPRDMGKVMGPAMKQMKGKADGAKVQSLVKEKLAG